MPAEIRCFPSTLGLAVRCSIDRLPAPKASALLFLASRTTTWRSYPGWSYLLHNGPPSTWRGREAPDQTHYSRSAFALLKGYSPAGSVGTNEIAQPLLLAMTTFIALLRAVNVGGTAILPMQDLVALCVELGLTEVRTYIQSGNVVFDSTQSEGEIVAALEKALSIRMGGPIDVMVRTANALSSVLAANPFPAAKPAQVAVLFLTKPLVADALRGVDIPGREEIGPGLREIYIHYPDGMGRSKLKLPRDIVGTARNLNTVAKLIEMAGK